MNPLAVCVHQSHGPIKSLVVLYGKLRQRPQLTCMVGLGEPLPSPLPAEPSSKCAGDDAQRSQKDLEQAVLFDLLLSGLGHYKACLHELIEFLFLNYLAY